MSEFGLMYYNARWYDPALGRFVQADTIVPQPGDVRGWDRYAYVRNNPTGRIDPTGHMDDGWEGGCNDVNSCKHEYLRGTAIVLLTRLGGRNDLEAMAQIVDYAAYLYGNYQQMMPMLSGIFLGLEQSNSITVFNAAFRDYNACNLAIGREQNDCKTEDGRSFKDLGFHPDFRDNHNQLFHFWAYVSTTAATETRWDFVYSPLIPPGVTVSLLANNYHEIIAPDDQASWEDYALAVYGVQTGMLIRYGIIPPDQLGNYLRDMLGEDGPGSGGAVIWLNSHFPFVQREEKR